MTEPGAGWAAPANPQPRETTPLRPPVPQARLNVSTNVVLLFRLNELKELCFVNFVLACLTLLYLSVNVCLFWLNVLIKSDCDDGGDIHAARCGSPVSAYQYHLTEFWATFCYAGVEAFALVYTPRALSSISTRPLLLKVLLFFDVVATFVPACLVTANLERFERVAHEVEYSNELTMAFVNLVLLASLLRRRDDDPGSDGRTTAWIAGGAAACAALQIVVYNSGTPGCERNAHFLEFSFAILSSFVTFWFCLDNRSIGEEEILCILYGDHRDCSNCNVVHAAKRSELVQLADSRTLNQLVRARKRSGEGAEIGGNHAAASCGLV